MIAVEMLMAGRGEVAIASIAAGEVFFQGLLAVVVVVGGGLKGTVIVHCRHFGWFGKGFLGNDGYIGRGKLQVVLEGSAVVGLYGRSGEGWEMGREKEITSKKMSSMSKERGR